MLYLAGSILFTTYLSIFFKVSGRLGLNTLQVIVFNYITCVITGLFMQSDLPTVTEIVESDWIYWALGMGIGFISLFNLIAFSTQHIGIAVTSVAYKLSLVIPFVFSIFLFNEHISAFKWAGIALAIIAVILTCYTSENKNSNGISTLYIFVPVIIFMGSGLLDTAIKYTEHYFLDGTNNNSFLSTAFGFAAFLGLVTLLVNNFRIKTTLQPGAILAGILLGIPNYFSIWCLVEALKSFPGASTFIIPVNNMAVVLLSAIIAGLFFRERLSVTNWVGIVLALLSIILIADITPVD